jgi:hypothetical protein
MLLRWTDRRQREKTGSPDETTSLEDYETSKQECDATKGHHPDLDVSNIEALLGD